MTNKLHKESDSLSEKSCMAFGKRRAFALKGKKASCEEESFS